MFQIVPSTLPESTGWQIGYARVSTDDQSLDMQIAALEKAGVKSDCIYSEKISGVSKKREQLALAIEACRPGDTFVVWKLDRMGRSLLDLLDKLKQLEDKGVGFRSITEGIDTTTPGGRLILHMMAALAEFERDLVVERTREGVKRYIEKGGQIGRERQMTDEAIATVSDMFKQGASAAEAARAVGVTPQCIYRYFPGGPSKYR